MIQGIEIVCDVEPVDEKELLIIDRQRKTKISKPTKTKPVFYSLNCLFHSELQTLGG